MPAPLGAVELVGGRVVAASVLPAGTRVQAGHERVRVELRQREVESEVKTCGLQWTVSEDNRCHIGGCYEQ